MREVELQLNAQWIIPVNEHDEVLEHHALLIDAGRIVDIVPQKDTAGAFQAKKIVELNDHALIPGLINAHTHAAMSLMRGIADDLPLMTWLQDHIWPVEGKWVSPDFIRDGTRLAMAEMLRSGTTCFNDMYFFPDEVAHEVESAGMRAVLGLIMLDFPTPWAQSAEEYLHKGLALHDKVRHNPLLHTAMAPHAPYTVSDEPLRQVVTYAEELDIPIHMHVHETAEEVQQGVEQHGVSPLHRLRALGLLSPRLMAVHMTQLTDEDIELYAESGGHILHCPESNLKLANGFCPVHRIRGAGINMALGTDGAASNNDLDMFGEMHTAALLSKGVAREATALPAMEALRMATINGAKALGIDSVTGSLEAGKSADITAVRLDTLECQPIYNPVSQLVYAAGREQVTDVWVAGKQLLKERRLTTLDETLIKQKSMEWREKIRPSINHSSTLGAEL